MLETPILFMVFNRPQTTARVLGAIRQAKPRRLFVAADGPRPGKPGELERCQAVRNLVREGIDWNCEVQTLLREENLGCKRAVSSAITWFFEQVEEGIVLEDDTLPTPSFFAYCQALLERYRHNTSVLHVGANNFQFGRKRGPGSYYFSIYPHIWGWATWRRAWHLYDVEMKLYRAHREDERWQSMLNSPEERGYWRGIFDQVAAGKIDTWDYQWVFTNWFHRGLAILPNVNLVSNIGFGPEATHTIGTSPLANLAAHELPALVHPPEVTLARQADQFTFRHIFGGQPLPKRVPPVEKMRACWWEWQQRLKRT